jgi:hypothetical protein
MSTCTCGRTFRPPFCDSSHWLSDEEYATFYANKLIGLGGLYNGSAQLLQVDGFTGQIRTNVDAGFYDSEFLIRSNNTNDVMFHVSKSVGDFSFIVGKEGNDIFRSWGSIVSGNGWSIVTATSGVAYMNLGSVPRFAIIGSDVDIYSTDTLNIVEWNTGAGSAQYAILGSEKGLGYPSPYLDLYSHDDGAAPTLSGRSKISSIGDSYLAVNTGTFSKVGIGTIPNTNSKLQIRGFDNTSSNYSLLVQSASASNLLSVRNDGEFKVSTNIGSTFSIYSDTGKLEYLYDSNNYLSWNPQGGDLFEVYTNSATYSGYRASNGSIDIEMISSTSSTFINSTQDILFKITSSTVAEFDTDSTATNTRFLIYDVDTGSLQRVSVGATDSGGSGFRLLRIPNS